MLRARPRSWWLVGADEFMLRLRELAAVDVLKSYRQQAERLRDDELAKAQRLLANGSRRRKRCCCNWPVA